MSAARSRGVPGALVIGYFDPMLAAHARRLRACRASAGLLVVLIESPENPLLPAPARANLLAGLSSVDYVVLAAADQAELLAAFPPSATFYDHEAGAKDTRDLADRVHDRQSR